MLKHCQKVFFTLVEHPIIRHETLCFFMLLSYLSKSSSHISTWGREHEKRHMVRCYCLLYSKREEGMKAKQGLGVFSVSVLPTPASGAGSMVPTSIWDLGLGCDPFILKKHRNQKAGYSIWKWCLKRNQHKAAYPCVHWKNLGLQLLSIFVLLPYEEDAHNLWVAQRPKLLMSARSFGIECY